jgi:hypothetical protein
MKAGSTIPAEANENEWEDSQKRLRAKADELGIPR